MIILIYLWTWAALIAASFWEAYVEGNNSWEKGKLGWKFQVGPVILTAYHFWLFWIMFPLLMTLPFVVFGFDLVLFLHVLSAYIFGMILEDFFWFVVNPVYPLKNWNKKNVTWYPWIKLGWFEFPVGYILGSIASIIITTIAVML